MLSRAPVYRCQLSLCWSLLDCAACHSKGREKSRTIKPEFTSRCDVDLFIYFFRFGQGAMLKVALHNTFLTRLYSTLEICRHVNITSNGIVERDISAPQALLCCFNSLHSAGKTVFNILTLAAGNCSHSVTGALKKSMTDVRWWDLVCFQGSSSF